MRVSILCLVLTLCVLAFPTASFATVYNLTPLDDWYAVVGGSSLSPGDEVVLAAGTYTRSANIYISHRGTAQAPILIRAEDGAQVVFTHDSGHNIFEMSGPQYLTLRGLEFIGGSAAIRIYSGGGYLAKYVTIENCYIHDTGGNAITANHTGEIYEGLIFRRNHIHDTDGHGEAFYLGGNYNTATFHDGLVENNYIHHLVDTLNGYYQGDGIEIKDGSYNNVVRDNVIHDVNYPGVLVYGSNGHERNVVERNVIWNSGDNGIQAAADAIVRNNIVLNSAANNISSSDHQDAVVGNLNIVHNTVVSQYGSTGIRISNPVGGVISGPVVVANNAIYTTGSDLAIYAAGVTLAGNVESASLTADFVDVPNLNFYPTPASALLDAGDATYVANDDFNATLRNGDLDVGAYVYDPNGNPGWQVTGDFKQLGPIVPEAPVIADVTPDPDAATATQPYTRQLTLTAGTEPITWTLLDGPAGATIDQEGLVSGWTPDLSDVGTTFDFEAQASNDVDSDTEFWQVTVAAPPTPVIEEVTPDPDSVMAGNEYVEQLVLSQGAGTGVTWTLLTGPAGANVDQNGLVSGWTPDAADIGTTFDFEVQAGNDFGSDTESWQVYVPPTLPGFIEQGGLLVVEGEHFHSHMPGTLGHSWSTLTGLNSVGDGYVESGPNDGTNINTPNIETTSPRLSYTVNFNTAGTYYVWSRALGPDSGSDSFHYGLDGVSATSVFDDCAQTEGTASFAWYSQTPTHVRTILNVPTPGTHTVDVWMREAGAAIDRLLLTTSSTYIPSGDGPAESPRSIGTVLVASEPPADGTLPKTQNNVILLTFSDTIALPAGPALSIVPMGGGADVGASFDYSVETDGVTLKAVEQATVLTNQTWYQITPAAGFVVEPFTLDVCTLVGDANNTGRITTADYADVKAHMSEYTDARYDLNGSGRITTADYSVVKSHMSERAPVKP